LTGCRKGEVLNLTADEVDLSGRFLRLVDTKTGDQWRPVGKAALDLFEALSAEENSKWLFPAGRGEGHVVNLTKPMAKICIMADLEGVTAHTLRHSYATVAHELDYSELTISGLLGHSSNSVTSRYTHRVDKALARAADQVSAEISGRMGAEDVTQSNVVEFSH